MRKSIYSMTKPQLQQWLLDNDEKKSRADLIWESLYQDLSTNFEEMTALSEQLLRKLQDQFLINPLTIVEIQEGGDKTTKFLFRLASNALIETVLMHQTYGSSVCVTTQIGCNIGCRFCASGLLTKQADLEAGEIVAQVVFVKRYLKERSSSNQVTHITVMGIGEPFDNYDEVIRFLSIVTDQKGMSIAPRRITVSTSGLAPKIRQFATESLPVNLAVSLHAPNDQIRSQLMRINDAYPMAELFDAIKEYIAKTKHRVFFEYIMIKDLNDQKSHAIELAELLLPLGKYAYVNLIPYNPVEENSFLRSERPTINKFLDELMQSGVNCIVRKELGAEIDGACGQLRSQYIKQEIQIL